LSKGKASYVTPAINYKIFGPIKIGSVFGISDMLLGWRRKYTHFCINAKYDYFNIKRRFSVVAVSVCSIMRLPVADMQIIQNEWPSEFLDLYRDAYKIMLRALHHRVKVYYDFLIQVQNNQGVKNDCC
jgi:hypothetical protein